MTQTAQPDPFDDLAARIQRLEDGAASMKYVQALQNRLESFELRLRTVERAIPLREPKTRTGPPPRLPRSRDEASEREEEAIRLARQHLEQMVHGVEARPSPFAQEVVNEFESRFEERFRSISEKLEAILRRLKWG